MYLISSLHNTIYVIRII